MMIATIHRTHRTSRRGFTLIEMLIVAALISLFSGLAVINISQQLRLNQQKAAVAECRQIATSMSFANDDMGVFPKLCFLKFNGPNLADMLQGTPVVQNPVFEIYGNEVGNLGQRLNSQWKGGYMSFNSDRLVKMNVPAANRDYDWPADPWGNPYVAYMIYSDPKEVDPAARERFIDVAGKAPNFLAAVVTYGRNRVPGLGEVPGLQEAARKDLRLYTDDPGGDTRRFILLDAAQLNGANRAERIDMVRIAPRTGQTDDPNSPRVRQTGADDRIYEF